MNQLTEMGRATGISDGRTGLVNSLVLRSVIIHLNLLGFKTASLPRRYKYAQSRTKQKINKSTVQIGWAAVAGGSAVIYLSSVWDNKQPKQE